MMRSTIILSALGIMGLMAGSLSAEIILYQFEGATYDNLPVTGTISFDLSDGAVTELDIVVPADPSLGTLTAEFVLGGISFGGGAGSGQFNANDETNTYTIQMNYGQASPGADETFIQGLFYGGNVTGNDGNSFYTLQGDGAFVPTPEPASAAMLFLGAVGLIGATRRRR